MNKFAIGILALAFSWAAPAQANNNSLAIELAVANIQVSVAGEMETMNVINWEVGENSNYKMTSLFGELGTMAKRVDREQGNAIWVISETSGQMGDNTVEMLIDRATAQTLEYIENGQRKEPPSNDDFELIDQSEERITVPAGTFDTIKITGKTSQIKKLELWANPSEVVMEGSVQMKADTGFLPITMQLTSFGR